MALLGWRGKEQQAPRKLSGWLVGTYAALAFLLGGGAIWWAWPPVLASAVEQTKAEAEAIRTGVTTAGIAGAVFTLMLTVRKQNSTEKMDAATQHDAEERRVTDLYVAAVEQLGHDKAAVRLGGIYALERLGRNYPEHRRLIVNMWCAYLKMWSATPNSEAGDDTHQERPVRDTVQRLLRRYVHSAPDPGKPPNPDYWGDDLDVDLSGARFHDLDLSLCNVHPNTNFTGAVFEGATDFLGAKLEHVDFRGARFVGAWPDSRACFNLARFSEITRFDYACFSPPAEFIGATFGTVHFDHATFNDPAVFREAKFTRLASFQTVHFAYIVSFAEASFHRVDFADVDAEGEVSFDSATFRGHALLGRARFCVPPTFDGAVACWDPGQKIPAHEWPDGWRLDTSDSSAPGEFPLKPC